MSVPWFLWSIVYPATFSTKEIHAQPVKEFASQEECEEALKEYRVEVDKAYPQPTLENLKNITVISWTTVDLKCSPVNPKP